jgi:hypothetical protein
VLLRWRQVDWWWRVHEAERAHLRGAPLRYASGRAGEPVLAPPRKAPIGEPPARDPHLLLTEGWFFGTPLSTTWLHPVEPCDVFRCDAFRRSAWGGSGEEY